VANHPRRDTARTFGCGGRGAQIPCVEGNTVRATAGSDPVVALAPGS